MKLNTPIYNPKFTHEGGPAYSGQLSIDQQLRRCVCSCLLWEKEFYEDGKSIADRIVELASMAKPENLAALAIEARETFNLRHVPLLLLDVLSKTGPELTAGTVARVLQRADEPGELMAIHWRNGRKMIPRQMRLGIARALCKFDAYQLAKYDRDGAVKLRDVFRIARPKPTTSEQATLWQAVVKRTLTPPDTWEVALSAGADKKETFERLLHEGNLGYLALLRNLRNMVQAGCDPRFVINAINARKSAQRVLPFRYVAAARAAPMFEPYLDQALRAAIEELPPLPGMTAILVDVSASMHARLSSKSDMTRMDAAAALGAILPGQVRVFTFSTVVVEVPPRRGMAGVDAIIHSQEHSGTALGAAIQAINDQIPHDRMIVITDEQSHDRVPTNVKNSYMINVASAQNGVGYGSWVHIDGFSESVLRFIHEIERTDDALQ